MKRWGRRSIEGRRIEMDRGRGKRKGIGRRKRKKDRRSTLRRNNDIIYSLSFF